MHAPLYDPGGLSRHLALRAWNCGLPHCGTASAFPSASRRLSLRTTISHYFVGSITQPASSLHLASLRSPRRSATSLVSTLSSCVANGSQTIRLHEGRFTTDLMASLWSGGTRARLDSHPLGNYNLFPRLVLLFPRFWTHWHNPHKCGTTNRGMLARGPVS